MPSLEEWAEDLTRKGFREIVTEKMGNVGIVSGTRPDGRVFRGILTRDVKGGTVMKALQAAQSAEVIILLVPFGKAKEAAQLARLSGDCGKVHVEEFMG
jgi:predicted dinucleotide-binding enzyme